MGGEIKLLVKKNEIHFCSFSSIWNDAGEPLCSFFQPEEALNRVFGVSREFPERFGAGLRDAPGGVQDMGRFTALTAIRDRCEVGGIGFYHELAGRSLARGIENLGRVFEGGDAGEGDEAPEIQDAFGLGKWTREAVEDGL